MARIGTVIRDVYRRPGVDALPAHLEREYGIRVAATTRLDAGVLKVERHDGPPWVARLFLAGRPLVRTEEDADVLRFLDRRGFPAERCAHPTPVSSLDGQAVLVTDYIAGGAVPNTVAFRRTLGAMLGRLFALECEPGATGRPAGSLHHLPDFEGGPDQDLAAAAALLADLEGRVPDKYRGVYESLQELLPAGDGGAGLPVSFIHPDPARSNVIAGPMGPVLVDWTGAGRGPRLASMAVLLHSVGPKQVDDLLAGYRLHGAFTGEELDRLEGVLLVRPLWLACWQCWLAVVSKKVTNAFVPDRGRISAIAERVRVGAGGGADGGTGGGATPALSPED